MRIGDDLGSNAPTIVPPLPHLQAEPYHEIEATLMEQKPTASTTYGWNDAAHQSAHTSRSSTRDAIR